MIIMKKKPHNIKQKEWDAVDSPPLSKKMLSRMQPVKKAHPAIPPRVRGPQVIPTKRQLTLRLNRDVVEYFKLHGKGWQTQINDVLVEYVRSQDENKSNI